jgi:hypothetical protein
MPLLLANATHTVFNPFTCGSRHVIDAARGGAVVQR